MTDGSAVERCRDVHLSSLLCLQTRSSLLSSALIDGLQSVCRINRYSVRLIRCNPALLILGSFLLAVLLLFFFFICLLTLIETLSGVSEIYNL